MIKQVLQPNDTSMIYTEFYLVEFKGGGGKNDGKRMHPSLQLFWRVVGRRVENRESELAKAPGSDMVTSKDMSG